MAQGEPRNGYVWEIKRLRRIPPLSELESQQTDERLKERA